MKVAVFIFFVGRFVLSQAQLSVGCSADTVLEDSNCDGTLLAPCLANIAGFGIGDYVQIYYEQLGTLVSNPEMCASDGTACELYTSSIYVKVIGESSEYDVQLSNFGIFNLCKESCLTPTGDSFTGVCQGPDDGNLELGCINPAPDATTFDLCSSALISTSVNNKAVSIMEVGLCDVNALDWTDDSKPCTKVEPCEVMILDYVANGGAVGDLVEILYTQEESSDINFGKVCAESSGASDAGSCEAYTHRIYATVLDAAPSSSEVELSPHGIRSLCIGPCNSGRVFGYFSGVCQLLPDSSDGTECNWPTGTGSVCGAPLVGKITYQPVGPDTSTVADTSTEAPIEQKETTSASNSLWVVIGLTTWFIAL